MIVKLKHLPNLDLLRSLAILMVLLYHVVQYFDLPKIRSITSIGKYGVELFFVLSGFLIGCLYFNERYSNGVVDIKNFILRRVSRTLPSYFIMLIPAYFSVFLFRGEIFDIRFLFFLQNYILQIPFFKVSWSICVEEHFYLLLPFVLALIYKMKSNLLIVSLIITLLFSPLIFRIIEFKQVNFFGYYETASHFHFDSMILGVIASWLYTFKKLNFSKSIKVVCIVLFFIVFVFAIFVTREVMFVYGKFFLSLSFSLLILVFADSKQLKISKSALNSILAKSSYATYLSHALIINFYTSVINIKSNNSLVFISFNILAMVVLSLFVGFFFYFVIETRIMNMREKFVPKKNLLLHT